MTPDKQKEMLFPHKEIRPIQDELIKDVQGCIENKKHLIAHAPTGLGKSAATIPIALAYALKHDKTVFFLTSRHTQHKIAIDTLKEIKKLHNAEFHISDMIGKIYMCAQPSANILTSSEFFTYCKHLKEEGTCEFYTNTREKKSQTPTVKADHITNKIISEGPLSAEEVTKQASEEKLCPYEIGLIASKKAKVIVADYSQVFNPGIQPNFFTRTNKKLENSIVIVDEAHNLPTRVRDSMTIRLSTFMLSRAINEAKKYKLDETLQLLEKLVEVLKELTESSENQELLITKDQFINKIEEWCDYDQLQTDLEFIADDIRNKQKQSQLGGIALFLGLWNGDDKGYTRILTKTNKAITLTYRCLDPGLVIKDTLKATHSTILMSGTLTPTDMYKDLLGLEDERTVEKIYDSPFPDKNKQNLIIPRTTTKYSKRCEEQYKQIAKVCAEITNAVPGNTAIFFPSYYLRDEVNRFFADLSKKTILYEAPNLSNAEKHEILDKFKQYKKVGAALLGVSAGSFGEGIDLPGDLLKCVVVVGLPLNKPDLETKEVIEYYDDKFGRGWDYGYLFPAFNRCLQSAGRCIRSETDRGTIIFLDERFTWPNYFRCFPEDWELKITLDYEREVEQFFCP